MRSLRVGCLLSVLWLLPIAGSAYGAEEPKGFADIPWGMSSQDARAKLIGRCSGLNTDSPRDPNPVERISCPGFFIEGLTGTNVFLDFVENRFAGYLMSGPPKEAAYLASVLKDKWGRPTSEDTASYKNRLGMSITGGQLWWMWPSGTVAVFQERCTRLDVMCVQVSSKESRDALLKQGRENRERTGKGF